MGLGHNHTHGVGTSAGVGRSTSGSDSRVIARMYIGLAVLLGFLILEVTVGLMIGSLALLADAGHMLTDVLALCMGLIALLLARRTAVAPARTFGWHRAEVLTAVANALLLVGVAVYILVEAIHRVGEAPRVPGWPLIGTALAGLAANIVVMLLLRRASADSLAVRGAYMEVLADAVSSIGVIIAGIVTVATGWRYADIVVAIGISLFVAPRAVMLGASALRILIQQSPRSVDLDEIRTELEAIDGVSGAHDLHVWSLTVGMDVVTVHLTTTGEHSAALREAKGVLARHGLDHATVQVESPSDAKRCSAEVTW